MESELSLYPFMGHPFVGLAFFMRAAPTSLEGALHAKAARERRPGGLADVVPATSGRFPIPAQDCMLRRIGYQIPNRPDVRNPFTCCDAITNTQSRFVSRRLPRLRITT